MVNPEVESPPEADDCRALVQRIIASKEFQRANRLRDFLTYVVERQLEGSPNEVSEVLVAHRVFGRPASYHPGEDSIVRTEARILRQRLDRYFAEEGRSEPITLEIPKGSYLPLFRRRVILLAAATTAQPTVVNRDRISNLRIWLYAFCLVVAALTMWSFERARPSAAVAPAATRFSAAGTVELDSSDARLVNGFRWAKQRALAYAYTGDAVGDWYDSTAGDRYAFCIRDASHQSIGAAVLVLLATPGICSIALPPAFRNKKTGADFGRLIRIPFRLRSITRTTVISGIACRPISI